MKKIILIGKTENGKTTLRQKLNQQAVMYQKTQSMEYENSILDTPGEYMENRRFYNALITGSVDCDVIGLVQAANETYLTFPPGFGSMFNKPIIGIITKVDLVKEITETEKHLRQAGAERIFLFSAVTDEGLKEIQAYLQKA